VITYAELKELFEYKNGNLYQKAKTSKKVNIGDIAGCLSQSGYRYITINFVQYLEHRIIFALHHGFMPEFIDHIDGNIANNCIENLRPSSHSQNMRNKKMYKSNVSGYKNVSWDNQTKKWRVQIRTDLGRKIIGRFDDIELADLVAMEARNKYHKEFARNA